MDLFSFFYKTALLTLIFHGLDQAGCNLRHEEGGWLQLPLNSKMAAGTCASGP